jgi:putative spermidine/putrescine transport system permease protein
MATPVRARMDILYVLPLAFLFAAVVALPFARVLVGSLEDGSPDGPGLGNYAKALGSGAVLRSIRNSISLSLWSTALGGALGFFFALAVSRVRGRARDILIAANSLPLTLSGVVIAYGFLAVYGRAGVYNGLLRGLGAPEWLQANILSLGGLVFVYLIFQIPLMTTIVLSAIFSLDPHIEEAARSVGAGRARVIARILFPQLLPAVLAGLSLLFINAFGAYATAFALTGSNVNLVTLKIAAQISDVAYDPGTANALSVLVVIVDTVFVALYRISLDASHGRRP